MIVLKSVGHSATAFRNFAIRQLSIPQNDIRQHDQMAKIFRKKSLAINYSDKGIRKHLFRKYPFGKRYKEIWQSATIYSAKWDLEKSPFGNKLFRKIDSATHRVITYKFSNYLSSEIFLPRNDFIPCQLNARHRTWNWILDRTLQILCFI